MTYQNHNKVTIGTTFLNMSTLQMYNTTISTSMEAKSYLLLCCKYNWNFQTRHNKRGYNKGELREKGH
jgi:hypothetical protein